MAFGHPVIHLHCPFFTDAGEFLNRKRPGDTVTLTIYRGGKKLDVPVKLGERDGN